MDKKVALKQFREIEKLASDLRLAADGWDEDWKTLIATLMSARTTDKKTIPIATLLFEKFDSVVKLAGARYDEVANIIRPVNFYRGKTKRIIELCKTLQRDYNGKVPHDFEKLIEFPGIGRKTANVFLAVKGYGTIGVDTHVAFISREMGWTKHESQEKIENDLENLFDKKYWGKLNWVLVRFGQTYKSRKIKKKILSEIKKKFNG